MTIGGTVFIFRLKECYVMHKGSDEKSYKAFGWKPGSLKHLLSVVAQNIISAALILINQVLISVISVTSTNCLVDVAENETECRQHGHYLINL